MRREKQSSVIKEILDLVSAGLIAQQLTAFRFVKAVNIFMSVNESTKMAVFWDVVPCSPVEDYRRFRGACCLHHQSDEPSANFYQT
jgi:hypothetical protein